MSDARTEEGFGRLPASVFFTLYGEVLYLLCHAPVQRAYTVEDIEQRILRPMSMDQFRIYRRETGPVALLTWAFLSDELDRRMHDEAVDLGPDDWKSGAHLWYMDFVAPFGHANQVIRDMLENVFPDRLGKSQRVTDRHARDFSVRRFYGRALRGGKSAAPDVT